MTTLDSGADGGWLHTKGAPEAVLPLCAARYLLLLLPYPLIVCGADELRKYLIRHTRRFRPA